MTDTSYHEDSVTVATWGFLTSPDAPTVDPVAVDPVARWLAIGSLAVAVAAFVWRIVEWRRTGPRVSIKDLHIQYDGTSRPPRSARQRASGAYRRVPQVSRLSSSS